MDHTGDPQFWTADLYLVTGPAANTAGQVTIYDGIQWGWVNDLPALPVPKPDKVPPLMLKTPANPKGLPMEVVDKLRSSIMKDRSQFDKDLAIPLYDANRRGAKVSQGTLDQFWLWSMQAGLKNAYESIKAFSETDQTEDLKKFDVPTLVLHGDDDQIVPVHGSAKKSGKLIKGAKEVYYPGAPHGLTATQQDLVSADLLAFLRS
jgi:non-heme chloroperoxidase